MEHHRNQVMADLIHDDLDKLDQANTIVVHAYGPDQMCIKKTFSDTSIQDFSVARKHVANMFRELEASWTEDELVDLTVNIPAELEEGLIARALDEIKDDRDGLLKYAVSKALQVKCQEHAIT